MKLSAISLHPAMTLQNMAAWCALHDRVLVITWRVRGGELQPVASATTIASPASSTSKNRCAEPLLAAMALGVAGAVASARG